MAYPRAENTGVPKCGIGISGMEVQCSLSYACAKRGTKIQTNLSNLILRPANIASAVLKLSRKIEPRSRAFCYGFRMTSGKNRTRACMN
jgi:hypothetical protein